MDPLTHVVSGIAAGRAFQSKFPKAKYFTFFAGLAAAIPDIDILVGSDPILNLGFRRSFTHGILGVPLLAALLSFVAVKYFGFGKLKSAFGFFLCLVGLHVYLDVPNSYGTQFLFPFSTTRFSIDSVYIIDLFFLALLLVLALLGWLLRERRSLIGVLGLSVALGYPMMNLSIKTGVRHKVAEQLSEQQIHYDHLHVASDAFSPFRWKVILEDGSMYKTTGATLFGLTQNTVWETYEKASRFELEGLAQNIPFFKTYSWFVVYPAIEREATAEGSKVIWKDLRFMSSVDWVRNLRGSDSAQPPFSVEANFDRSGKLLRYTYHTGGSAQVFELP